MLCFVESRPLVVRNVFAKGAASCLGDGAQECRVFVVPALSGSWQGVESVGERVERGRPVSDDCSWCTVGVEETLWQC